MVWKPQDANQLQKFRASDAATQIRSCIYRLTIDGQCRMEKLCYQANERSLETILVL